MLILATSNPQIFEFDNWAALPAIIIGLSLLAATVLLRLAATPTLNRWRADPKRMPGDKSPTRHVGYLCLTLLAGALLTPVALLILSGVNYNTQTGAYKAELRTWLASEYNTDVSPEFAGRLLTESLVVNLDGSRQVVSLVEGSNGNLEVVNEAGDVVKTAR